MRSTMAAAAAALTLCGCNNSPAQKAPAPHSLSGPTKAQTQLHQASDLNRAIGLKRAIYDSGYRCKRISSSGFSGTYKNLEMWTARCADGRDWAVFVGPDGSAQVRDCKDVAQIGLPKCAIKSKEEAARKTG